VNVVNAGDIEKLGGGAPFFSVRVQLEGREGYRGDSMGHSASQAVSISQERTK
jgi:hypothetical protein